VAPKLAELLGGQVVVENRPGANAIIGTDYVAKAAPDGYTLTLTGVSPIVISPHTYPRLPYDPMVDFVAITTVAMTPELIAVHPSLPVRSLTDLIRLARTKPGQLNFASSGNGGLPHLAIELLKSAAKIDLQHVAYKGAAPALTDLLGGHVHGFVIDFPVLYPHVKSGKARGLAVTNERRAALLPELPTSVEQGLPALIAVNWFAILAPAKTPRPIIDRLYAALSKASASPDLQQRLLSQGVETMAMPSPESLKAFMQTELARWGKVVQESGARAD
jgi:tripartite-type tricarboxylate transporter receptor subunit TctC